MFSNNEYEEKTPDIIGTVDISVYVSDFFDRLAKHDKRRRQIKTEGDAMVMKSLIDQPRDSSFKVMLGYKPYEEPYWIYQKVVYAPSNLGKGRGFVFYFICEKCGRNSKRLYFYDPFQPPMCRLCCRIKYRQPTRPQRRISRFIRRHPEAAREFINSYGLGY